MKSINNKTIIGSIVFILIAAFSRLITTLPNFSAIEAIALFGGAYMATRFIAFIIPIAALYLSDLLINNTIFRSFYPDHEGLVLWSDYMIWNAIAMVLIVLIGIKLLKKITAARVIGGSLLASTLFFIITNFGAWMTSPLYTKDLAGLIMSYEAAIPFFQNSILGTLVFSMILFGSFEAIRALYIKEEESSKELATEKVKA